MIHVLIVCGPAKALSLFLSVWLRKLCGLVWSLFAYPSLVYSLCLNIYILLTFDVIQESRKDPHRAVRGTRLHRDYSIYDNCIWRSWSVSVPYLEMLLSASSRLLEGSATFSLIVRLESATSGQGEFWLFWKIFIQHSLLFLRQKRSGIKIYSFQM